MRRSVISEIISLFESEYIEEYVTANLSLKCFENTERLIKLNSLKSTEEGVVTEIRWYLMC